MKRAPFVVTRAGDPGAALARALALAGEDVLWLPAFELGPAPDENRATALLGHLDAYDLAVFVSPAAVEAVAARLERPWPRTTSIGAVGDATRRALLARIGGAQDATVFAPAGPEADGEGGGSEPLWHAVQPELQRLRRVLILRAQSGREWLGEQFAAAGARVENLAVYTRRPAVPAGVAAERLRQWERAGKAPVLVIASSEAVAAVLEQLDRVVDPAWTRSAPVLASHERVAARLRSAGFANVKVVALEAEAIRHAAFAQ